MNTVNKLSGAAIAAVAAGMIMSGCETTGGSTAAKSKEAKVHCYGVNACKGTTACKTATNACKGQNSCKGTGWVPMGAAECKEAGGTVEG